MKVASSWRRVDTGVMSQLLVLLYRSRAYAIPFLRLDHPPLPQLWRRVALQHCSTQQTNKQNSFIHTRFIYRSSKNEYSTFTCSSSPSSSNGIFVGMLARAPFAFTSSKGDGEGASGEGEGDEGAGSRREEMRWRILSWKEMDGRRRSRGHWVRMRR